MKHASYIRKTTLTWPNTCYIVYPMHRAFQHIFFSVFWFAMPHLKTQWLPVAATKGYRYFSCYFLQVFISPIYTPTPVCVVGVWRYQYALNEVCHCIWPRLKATLFIPVLNGHHQRWGKKPAIIEREGAQQGQLTESVPLQLLQWTIKLVPFYFDLLPASSRYLLQGFCVFYMSLYSSGNKSEQGFLDSLFLEAFLVLWKW